MEPRLITAYVLLFVFILAVVGVACIPRINRYRERRRRRRERDWLSDQSGG